MSAPLTLILGFGTPGPLLQKSLDAANCRFLSLPGTFADLARPQPSVWRSVAAALEEHRPDSVVWAQDALILWDRLQRALAVNHKPDFLWPLSLLLKDGKVEPCETDLFLAVGGFELSLFHFRALHDFHHAVRGRALAKLLAVSNTETMTIADYLHQSWLNFESVKAPDPWLIGVSDAFSFTALGRVLDDAMPTFIAQHSQWQMGRVALEARSRNTLAAADVARSNLDSMQLRMEGLMQRMSYYGFWPMKAGTSRLVLPCTGHHPVVDALIWRGSYCGKAVDLWNALFCQGGYTSVIDTRGDGHVFGLLFAAQQKSAVTCYAPSLQAASWAQAAIEANGLNVSIDMNAQPKADPDALAVIDENDDRLWGAVDLFIPFEKPPHHIQKRAIPAGYTALICAEDKLSLTQISDLSSVQEASVLVVLKKERAQKIMGGGKS